MARELGSERRETVRSLSVVGAGDSRGPDSSTRGPGLGRAASEPVMTPVVRLG